MIDYLLWLALALGAACVVFSLALRSGVDASDEPRGVRRFVDDLRAGLSDRSRAPEEISQDSSLEEFLTAASRPGQAYLGPDDVASLLERRR